MLLLLSVLACDSPATKDSVAAGPPAPAYTDGVYTCCAEGDGEDCCEDAEPGMCFEYGGLYEACIPDGEIYEAKIICAFCCNGELGREPMDETDEVYDGYPEGCGPGEETVSFLVCVTCGDGTCGEGENRCVCPEDCA